MSSLARTFCLTALVFAVVCFWVGSRSQTLNCEHVANGVSCTVQTSYLFGAFSKEGAAGLVFSASLAGDMNAKTLAAFVNEMRGIGFEVGDLSSARLTELQTQIRTFAQMQNNRPLSFDSGLQIPQLIFALTLLALVIYTAARNAWFFEALATAEKKRGRWTAPSQREDDL